MDNLNNGLGHNFPSAVHGGPHRTADFLTRCMRKYHCEQRQNMRISVLFFFFLIAPKQNEKDTILNYKGFEANAPKQTNKTKKKNVHIFGGTTHKIPTNCQRFM